MYRLVPVRCPHSGGTLLAPLLPSAQACPKKIYFYFLFIDNSHATYGDHGEDM